MSCAKVFILICLIFLLPSLSFATIGNDSFKNNSGYFYIGGEYKPGTPHFNRFSVTNSDIKELVSLKQEYRSTIPYMTQDTTLFNLLKNNSNFTLPYDPTYTKNLLGVGGIVGYSLDNFRIELEAFYEKFNIKVPSGYFYDNFYEYFALTPTAAKHTTNKHYCMKNTGITLSPFLVNACYDFILKKTSNIAPYLCIGVGGNFIDFLDQTNFKFAYQAKVGISYFISSNLSFFIDGSFHGHFDNQFSDLLVDYPTDLKFTTISAKFNINFLTSSVGIRFIS
ncbi:P44/Msp2 family outer membrane protein [Ehrlichia japonica]|uniref:Surface antigen family protein n=1 Tax=Ehrlichia japonica TaxID=391036 RepID=X5GL01_9RICK|nr:P44/Msp2 family outer membrane protein [Ehrlichia japonica]AHX04826.1 surface antigen family protein [Ehrlichia japonica]